MIFPVYRDFVDGLSFERTGSMVAKVLVPEGSSLEPCKGLIHLDGFRSSGAVSRVLMVPSPDDPSVRYAWNSVDVVTDAGNPGSQFSIVEVYGAERNAISVATGNN